jgi:hypothetical protein
MLHHAEQKPGDRPVVLLLLVPSSSAGGDCRVARAK